MEGRKLLIADGHHRYETALNYRDAHPELADAVFRGSAALTGLDGERWLDFAVGRWD